MYFEPFGKDSSEAVVEQAVDDKVHDTVEDQQQMIDRSGANEPGGWEKGVSAFNHFIDVVEFIQVEKESGQVRDKEHANNEDEDQAQLKIFGLLAALVVCSFVPPSGQQESLIDSDVEVNEGSKWNDAQENSARDVHVVFDVDWVVPNTLFIISRK